MQIAKKVLAVFLSMLMVLSTATVGGAGFALTAAAADSAGQCGEDVYYTYDEESGVLRISGTGEMKGYYSLKSPFYGSDVRFVVVESGVTNIGAGAFNECKSLTNVAIAGSVDWIGSSAFDGCTSLTKISIPNGLTDFSSRVFDNCTALQSVTLPKTMDFIASNILNACSSFQVLNYCGTESDWGEITILNYAFPESLNIQYEYSAAADVEEAIDAIGTVEYSHWCKALIDAAVLAYDALEEDEKSLVKNYGVLQAALAEYARLENGAPVHTVTFDLAGGNINGDTTNPTQTGTVCMPIKPPADPEKEGCSFIGWEPAVDVFIPEGGRTYVAQWAILAADPHRAIWLAADGKADALPGAQQSNIWFGRYKQSSDGNGGFNVEPLKWRVLQNADGQLFLLSDLRLDAMQFFDYVDAANLSDPKNCTWQNSIVRSWLNGYPASEHGGNERIDYSANPEDSFIGSAFTSSEQDYIAETLLDNAYYTQHGVSGGPNTTDKIFLLSAGEAKSPAFGFTDNNDFSKSREARGTDYVIARGSGDSLLVGAWWLRSCGTPPSIACYVGGLGSVLSYYANDIFAIRPAFKMNVDSILFTSAPEGGKTAGGSLQEVEKYYGTDWKLTLKDNNHARFAASYVSAENGSCTIRYNNAATGTNEMISAMIVNQYGVVTYYGALCEAQNGENTVTIDLAGKLNEGDKVYVFNEQRNGDYETDYASALFDVTPTIAPDLLIDKADLKMNLNTNTAQTVWYGDSRWRVIGYDGAGAASESGTMTLFANAGMGTSYFDFDGKTGKQYAGSDLEKQTNQIYNNAFSDPEQLAVRDRTLNAGTYDGANTDGVEGSSVGYARLWPLSTKEANAVADLRKDTGAWWLRSPGDGVNNVAFVKKEGDVDHIGQSFRSESGVRPAFYVDLGRVLFASAAVGGKQGDGVLTPVEDVINAEWKLTLWESRRQWFTVTETSATATAGDTITLHYQYAEPGDNEYISAIVTDENGKALYYGRLTPATTEDGTVDIVLPADLAEGSYTLKVFNEQYNGDYKTDLASAPVDVTLTVEPLVTPDMTLEAESVTYGEECDVTVTLPDDATGTVSFKLTGHLEQNTYTFDDVAVVNGKAELHEKLNADDGYETVVTYSGDSQYAGAEGKCTFVVGKAPTELEITTSPDTLAYGDTLHVTVTLSGGTVFAADQIDEQTGEPAHGPGSVTISVDGKEYRTVTVDPDDVTIVLDGNVATLEVNGLTAGVHMIDAVFAGSDNYVGSTADATVEIGKKKIQEPTPIENLAYTGERQVGVNYDASLLGVAYEIGMGARVAATDAGTYGCSFRIKDNYKWANTDGAICEFTWSIGKASVEIPTAKENLICTGEEQIGVDYDESNGYTLVSGNAAGTGAGEYEATFALNDTKNYQWANGSTDPVTVSWSIGCKHEWKEPTWDWTQDVHNPTYTAQCNNCTDTATGTVPSDEGERVAATVDEDAYTPYTAEVKLGEQTFQDTFKVYEPGTAFEAYKEAQKKAADEKAQDGDSEKAGALIEAAKKAIDDVQFNENNTLQQNKDAVDAAANFAQLDKDLADQRAADAVEDKIDAIGDVEYTDESKQKIDAAREAYDDLTDEQKALVDNLKTLTDAEKAYNLLADKDAFSKYKDAQKKAAEDKRLPGDSAECKQLIDDTIDAINDVQYNDNDTLQQNKDAVDAAANLAQLDADLAEHRAIHYADFYADGKPVESVPYTIDTKSIDAPEVPDKPGYTAAWPDYTLKAGGVRVDAVYTPITYTAVFVAQGTRVGTAEYTVESTSIDEPEVPARTGYVGAWEPYTFEVGGMIVNAVYTLAAKPSVTIECAKKKACILYHDTVPFTAGISNLPDGAEVRWYVNGEYVGLGNMYAVIRATDNFTIQAKIIDTESGQALAESGVEKVTIRNSWFIRLLVAIRAAFLWMFSDVSLPVLSWIDKLFDAAA